MKYEPIAKDDTLDILELNRQLDKVQSSVFTHKFGGFYAPLMTLMDFVWTRTIPTAATDGLTMWWNPDWFMSLPFETRKTIFMHELRHPAGLHMLRCGDRDPRLWNIACDMNINSELEREGYTFVGFDGYFIEKTGLPFGTVEEDIYDHLVKVKWQDFRFLDMDFDGDDDDQDKAGQLNRILKNVSTAKNTAEITGSQLPGDLVEHLNQFLSPVVPWPTLLRRFFNQLMRKGTSWKRPSRRYQDVTAPGRTKNKGALDHLVFFQDTSGSIGQYEMIRFNSEAKYVKDVFRPKKMTMIQFDTKIQSIRVFEQNDPYDKIEIKGGGGTCLRCVRQWIIDNQPTAAVIFTDLQVEPMEPLPFTIPVFWIGINNPMAKVPFGTLTHIK